MGSLVILIILSALLDSKLNDMGGIGNALLYLSEQHIILHKLSIQVLRAGKWTNKTQEGFHCWFGKHKYV